MNGTARTTERHQSPVATTGTSTAPAKLPSQGEMKEALKTLCSDLASYNKENVRKEIKAPDREGFPVVSQLKYATPVSDISDSKPSITSVPSLWKLVTSLKRKTRRVSSVRVHSHKESGGTTDKTSDTNHKPSPSSSHPRPAPPPRMVRQTGKYSHLFHRRKGLCSLNPGMIHQWKGKWCVPVPESTTEPGEPGPESTRTRSATPRIQGPEEIR